MSLAGQRIVITRALQQSAHLVALIEAAGAVPVIYPCIDITPAENTTALDTSLKSIENYDWIIFTSSNTVTAIEKRLNALGLVIDWSSIQIAVVGSQTAEALEAAFGIRPNFIPDTYAASQLADELPLSGQQNILLPQSALANDELANLLRERGASVTTVDAYRNVIGTGGEDVPALIQQNQIDAITFTSGSTVRYFVERIAPVEAYHIPAICIGASTYEVAMEAGFQKAYFPENYTISDMMSVLVGLFDEVQHGNS